MKKMYEKPVAEVLRMDDTMQMICSSGFDTQTSFRVEQWNKTDKIDVEGTSDESISDDESTWPSLD